MDQQPTTVPALPTGDVLQFIIGGYLARFPAKTRIHYTISIRQWREWCESHGVDVLQVHRAHIEAWARHLQEERGLAISTVASKLTTICGMYRFAAIDRLIEFDPSTHVRRPRVEFISKTNGLTRPQAADLLRAAEADGPTTYALICLLALNGLRLGECLAADVEHLGMERGYRTLFLPCRKGGKVGTLALAVRTAYAVEHSLDGRTTGPLLLGRNGERLDMQAVRRTITRLCKQIRVTKRITPHSLRHSFVTMALDAGVPERDIIDSTGHASSAMVRYYDRNRGGIERNATHAVAAFIGAAS